MQQCQHALERGFHSTQYGKQFSIRPFSTLGKFGTKLIYLGALLTASLITNSICAQFLKLIRGSIILPLVLNFFSYFFTVQDLRSHRKKKKIASISTKYSLFPVHQISPLISIFFCGILILESFNFMKEVLFMFFLLNC